MIKVKLPPTWDVVKALDIDLLLKNWKKIREKRNEAAHIELIDNQCAMSLRTSLQELVDHHIFEWFHRLKEYYRR